MRSSIACARCRRSKIKCVNAGIDTTCRACESSGRECAYPTPAVGGAAAAAKRDLAALAEGDERNGHPDWESPKRQRSRKSVGLAAAAAKEAAAKASLDALDAPVLTLKVWEAVFDLFQSHVATLLPFLHPASFLAQIRPLAHGAGLPPASPPGAHGPPAPPPNPLIPLGVLALTARFHPTLVAYHAPTGAGAGGPDPLVASEVYATALRARLAGVDGASLAVPDLTRVQALLMLALHEWGMCRGKSAWLYVGMAIRLAQAMGLPWELEQDGVAPAAPAPLQVEAELFGLPRRAPPAREPTADDIIAQETKRRTFWACFLLDRCLSSGRYRPRMIRVRELGIQLPSDNAFAFGERVRTARLGEPPARRPPSFGTPGGPVIPSLRQSLGGFADDPRPGPASDAHHHHHHQPPSAWSPVARRADAAATAATDDEGIDRWEVGAEESVLGRVIRIVRLWGSIAQWSCAGGRRTEPVAPWHPESRFAHLRARLAEFQDGLARNLQYSSRNTETHIMYRHSLAPYTVMHVVYFLSVIVLHRAYIPFLPVHCPGPIGPLDEPGAVATDSTTTAGGPDGFWRDSARELFGAARRMMDLVLTCQERGVLVENPLVGFAVYHAAFVGVYAAHFPHMDPDGALRPPARSPTPPPDGPRPAAAGPSPARQMLDLLRRMRPRLRMARGWFRTVNRLHSYFAKVRRDVRRHTRRSDGGGAAVDDAGLDGLRPVREGGAGGGLDEFRLIEKLFLDFGTIEDQLPDTGSDASGDGGPVVAAAPPAAAPPAGPGGSDRATNPSDAGSSVARSETGDANEDPSGDSGVPPSGRRESWVPVNSPGLPPRGPDGDRRPSLPLPTTSRSLQSQSPFSLPALPPPPPPPPAPTDAPLYGHPSPTLPSLGTASSQAPRLQPLNSWLPPRGPPPPYAQSLPPISATAAHGLPLLPPPGAVGGPGGSSPGTADGWDSLAPPPGLWSTSLGGEDVLAFLEGCDYDQLPSPTASELGLPMGWLSTVWTEFAR
ncbi:fungal-specific transcription factor domain-domain-containing protein [Aspergillus taichungensis]|uniref:Fungal-specific transcription factor domain-domain-containing protein n=1 Tax=Aspergillus taichungensis TaxID=482145 RepID=A0A2J5HQQ2_9EURO|nr:fungal-specific transcription factor domain-domain-containing protein [Aspergillus taichungensis]